MSEHLNPARLQLFERLYEQVNNAKDRAIMFYDTEADRVDLLWTNRKWFHGDIVGIYSNGVEIKWDEYRRNCHVDGGTFNIPWDALADDTYKEYITSGVEKQVAKQRSDAAAVAAKNLAAKRQQLANLKAELGE